MDDQIATVPVNTWVQIEYLGLKKSKKGNREYKDFEVLYDTCCAYDTFWFGELTI